MRHAQRMEEAKIRKGKRVYAKPVTRLECKQAMEEYLANGGKITKIELTEDYEVIVTTKDTHEWLCTTVDKVEGHSESYYE